MHRLPGWVRAMICGLLLMLPLACAGTVKQPEVTLQSVQLGGLGLQGGTLLFNVSVVNPNRFEMSADQLQYNLMLADAGGAGDTTWIDFASGTFDESFSIPAGDTTEIPIPVDFTYSGLGGAAASLLRSGTFDYRARGSVDVRTPLGTYAVPFQRTGTVTLMQVN